MKAATSFARNPDPTKTMSAFEIGFDEVAGQEQRENDETRSGRD